MGTFSKDSTPWKVAPKRRVSARRAPVRSVPDTLNTRCDGCEAFECIEQERSRLHPWRFYCNRLKRELAYKELFEMSKRECPLHRDLRRRRFK